MRFERHIALVTGANHGIGRAIALALAAEGAAVAVGYGHDEPAASEVVSRILLAGGRAVALSADIRDPAAVEALVTRAELQLGPLDVVINSAGVVRRAALLDVTLEDWDEVMAVNARGTYLVCQHAARRMRERRRGAIVNVSSMRGVEGSASSPHYAAAKAAVISLTKSLARGLAPDIRVNAVAPGYVDTRIQAHLSPAERQTIESQTPLGRFGAPDDVANAVLFLASRDAAYVTGQTLLVDGGRVMI